MFSFADDSLNCSHQLGSTSVVSLPITEPEISPDRFCSFSDSDRSSICIRHFNVENGAESTLISLQTDDASSVDRELMTIINLTTRLHIHDSATNEKQSPLHPVPSSADTHQPLPRKRRQIHSPNELRLAVIRWKNSLSDAKYLLDNDMAGESHRAKLLDDLNELYQHRDAVACLSSKDSDVVGLVQILRFHCHKSTFGVTVRNLAIDILEGWTRRWFGKGLREKSANN